MIGRILNMTTKVMRPMIRSSRVIYSFSNAHDHHDHDHSHPDFQQQKKKAPEVNDQLLKEKHDFIDKTVKGNKVVLFMKGNPTAPMCGYSGYAVEVLKFYKVENYHSVDVLKDSVLREEVKKYSNWPTFPQLYVNGELIGGCDIMTEMHKEGSLKELFAKL